MDAGRKLNALIAEKVMGYRLKKEDCNSYWVDSDGLEPTHSHEYSTDISAAWDVVELLQKKLWQINLNWHNGKWSILLDKETDGEEIIAETAPHAICLAALALTDRA